mmetsp:Transcript_34635/g.78302  ORF Transcript_34635/g.78302 Transcript_34635/m.78302 type:complete len:305 (+) Transcript_34635:1681-2595(+)
MAELRVKLALLLQPGHLRSRLVHSSGEVAHQLGDALERRRLVLVLLVRDPVPGVLELLLLLCQLCLEFLDALVALGDPCFVLGDQVVDRLRLPIAKLLLEILVRLLQLVLQLHDLQVLLGELLFEAFELLGLFLCGTDVTVDRQVALVPAALGALFLAFALVLGLVPVFGVLGILLALVLDVFDVLADLLPHFIDLLLQVFGDIVELAGGVILWRLDRRLVLQLLETAGLHILLSEAIVVRDVVCLVLVDVSDHARVLGPVSHPVGLDVHPLRDLSPTTFAVLVKGLRPTGGSPCGVLCEQLEV